jgi:polyisoprenyl-phosphate glycosyltransferase
MSRVSILTAFYNEATNLPLFRDRVVSALESAAVDYEIVLIDDHSSDESPKIARDWLASDARVQYIRLSRNCGSHAAYSAGLSKCTGDAAILLAADLQDPPEMIPELLARWQDGYDVVWATRAARAGESWTTRLFAHLYYGLMRKFALPQMPQKGADFLLMGRKVIDAYNAIPEKNTSFLAIILWLGFRQTTVDYVKQARHSGKSKWSFSKKFKLLVDSLVSFSYLPIRLTSLVGVCVSILGFLYAIVVVVNAIGGHPVEGWSSLMVVTLLLGGFQLLMLGMFGEYLWRGYDEARGRPRYVIEEHLSSEDASHDRIAVERSIPSLERRSNGSSGISP